MNAVDLLNELNQMFKIELFGKEYSFYIPFGYNQKETTLSKSFKFIDDFNANKNFPYSDWKFIDSFTVIGLDTQNIDDESFNDIIKNKKFWCANWCKRNKFYIYDFKTHHLKHILDCDKEKGLLILMREEI